MAMPLPRSGASHFRLVRVEQSIPSLNGKTRIEGELLGIPDADGSMTVAHAIDVLTAEWIRENFGAGTYQIRWMGRRGERSHLQSLGNSLATILEDGAPEPQFRVPAPLPPPPPPPAAAPATPAHASPPFGSDPFTLFAYFEDKRELAIERERDRADRALEAERERAERAAVREQTLWQTLGMRSQAPATDPMLLAMLQEMRADSREVRERLRRLEEGYDDGDGDGDDGDAPPPYPPAAPLAPVANAPPAPQQRPPRDMNEALSRAGVELVGNLPGIIGAVGEMMRQQPAAAPPPPPPPSPPMLRPMVRLPPPAPPPPAPSPPPSSSTLVVSESDVNGWIDEAEAAKAEPDAAQ